MNQTIFNTKSRISIGFLLLFLLGCSNENNKKTAKKIPPEDFPLEMRVLGIRVLRSDVPQYSHSYYSGQDIVVRIVNHDMVPYKVYFPSCDAESQNFGLVDAVTLDTFQAEYGISATIAPKDTAMMWLFHSYGPTTSNFGIAWNDAVNYRQNGLIAYYNCTGSCGDSNDPCSKISIKSPVSKGFYLDSLILDAEHPESPTDSYFDKLR